MQEARAKLNIFTQTVEGDVIAVEKGVKETNQIIKTSKYDALNSMADSYTALSWSQDPLEKAGLATTLSIGSVVMPESLGDIGLSIATGAATKAYATPLVIGFNKIDDGFNSLLSKTSNYFSSKSSTSLSSGITKAEGAITEINYNSSNNLNSLGQKKFGSNYITEWKPNTTVIEFNTSLPKTDGFSRVYTDTKLTQTDAQGNWLLRTSDIEGLTPNQIYEIYKLPNIPTNIVPVELPSNVPLRSGLTPNGGKQYLILQDTKSKWFGDSQSLTNKTN